MRRWLRFWRGEGLGRLAVRGTRVACRYAGIVIAGMGPAMRGGYA